MDIKKRLKDSLVFFDGGMGTLLQEQGLAAGYAPEKWNQEKPEIILAAHQAYLAAGADIIKSNTFGANPFKMDSFEEAIRAGIALAKRAVLESGKDACVALDVGPLGKLLKPVGDCAFDEAYEAFAKMVKAGADAGADLVLIETMSDVYEAKAAILAAKENCSLPVFITFTFDEEGKLLTGADIVTAFTIAQSLGVDAVGFNCGLGPFEIKKFVAELAQFAEVPIIVNANAGLPAVENGKTVYRLSKELFVEEYQEIYASGARALGGCCGTTPAFIKALTAALKGHKPVALQKTVRTLVTSYARAVEFSDTATKIIGERINPTGKPLLKEALRNQDFPYLLKEALAQAEAGAHILDVNVGLPGTDECKNMERALTEIQSVTDLPLQIDTSDPLTMQRALRIYNGRPLLNSVNGKQSVMDAVFPLAAKYGAVLIALTLDDSGIPESAAERFKIAQKLVKEAAKYGIEKHRLIFDPLAMTVSTGKENALTALETLRLIRKELGAHTVLGVSNISFGLPKRELINTAFFTLAQAAGLSAGIINPMDTEMVNALFATSVLLGNDAGGMRYIERFAGETAPKKQEKGGGLTTLKEAVVKGLRDEAAGAAEKLLEEVAPLEVIDREIIPALDEVGDGFEKKRLFLPQLLMSAEAAKAAFDQIKRHLTKTSQVQEKRGKVIVATVWGDIHDIGKNIVKTLLENYNFDVIDLGKDVPPEVIVETTVRENVKLVGLSALMTTTVVHMEETIKQLRRVSDCKIMVGGAVLTEEYAKAIGADFYSKDAMGSVRYAAEILSGGME